MAMMGIISYKLRNEDEDNSAEQTTMIDQLKEEEKE
jgi:hypothetical protein